jgi:hypothetical protein
MAGMGAPAGVYGAIGPPPWDSWPPWSLQYRLQIIKPIEKKQKNGNDNIYEDVE